jgi:hypothetical protein
MLFGAWFLAEGGRLALQRSKARFGSVSASAICHDDARQDDMTDDWDGLHFAEWECEQDNMTIRTFREPC